MEDKKEVQRSRTYYIPESLAIAIENGAKEQDLSASQFVRKVIKDYLKRKEAKSE